MPEHYEFFLYESGLLFHWTLDRFIAIPEKNLELYKLRGHDPNWFLIRDRVPGISDCNNPDLYILFWDCFDTALSFFNNRHRVKKTICIARIRLNG